MGDYFYHKYDGSIDTSLVMQLWYKFLKVYLSSICITCSAYFEILATFDCFLMISRVLRSLKTSLFFKISTAAVVLVWFIFYIPELIYYRINSITIVDSNVSIHKIYNLTFSNQKIVVNWMNLTGFFRDIIPLTILLFLNILILITLHKVTKQKMKMKNSLETVSIMNAMRAERSKVKMIFFTGLIYLFHLPLSYSYYKISNEQNCFFLLSIVSNRFSFSISFFSYFFFNNNFRKYFYQLFSYNSANRVHFSTNS
jgi:hypothetical protein